MFLLGLLAIIQMVFLPGALFLKLAKIRPAGRIQFFLYSSGLSFYLNYLIVCLLTSIGLFIPPTVYILFLVEICCFLFLYKDKINWTGKQPGSEIKYNNNFINTSAGMTKVLFLFSCLIIVFYISLLLANFGTVFYFNDAINSWNPWAKEWAANVLPPDTGHYPQLLPANWSLIYIFTQTITMQLFTKAVMPLFFIGILFIFFDLAIKQKRGEYFAALIIYGIFSLVFYTILFITDGNADIPVSFFCFLAFYTAINQQNGRLDSKTVLLVIIFASSGANTKLAGLYFLCLFFLWIIYITFKSRTIVNKRDIFKTFVYIIFVLCGNLFWYFAKPAAMYQGLNQSPFLLMSYYARFQNALEIIYYTLSLPLIIFFAITLTCGLFVRISRVMFLLIIVPAMIMWTFFFSYDFRNLSIIVPFIAIVSSYGIKFISDKIALKSFTSGGDNRFIKQVFIPYIYILLFGFVFFIINSDYFFNLLMNMSVIINKLLFGNYRILYSVETGYYKHVEYFRKSINILLFITAGFFIIRKLKLKSVYGVYALLILFVGLNFTIYKRENLYQIQSDDEAMITAHNLYSQIKNFMPSYNAGYIYTNYPILQKLILPENMKIVFGSETGNNDLNFQEGIKDKFLLIDKTKLTEKSQEQIDIKIDKKIFVVCFENDKYIFLRIENKTKL